MLSWLFFVWTLFLAAAAVHHPVLCLRNFENTTMDSLLLTRDLNWPWRFQFLHELLTILSHSFICVLSSIKDYFQNDTQETVLESRTFFINWIRKYWITHAWDYRSRSLRSRPRRRRGGMSGRATQSRKERKTPSLNIIFRSNLSVPAFIR